MRHQGIVIDPDTTQKRPVSVASTNLLRQLSSPLSQHSDDQNKADNRGRIDSPLSVNHEASALLSPWSPYSSYTSRQASFRQDLHESNTITRHSSDLLHYFRLHIGRFWVCDILGTRLTPALILWLIRYTTIAV